MAPDARSLAERARALRDRIDNAAARPGDSADERLTKTILVFVGAFSALAAVVGAAFLHARAAPGAVSVLLAHAAATAIGLGHFVGAGDRRVFQALQLTLLLVTPFAVQAALGGFSAAGSVILWAAFAPLGALMFYGPRASVGWFVAYVVLTLLAHWAGTEPAAMWHAENLLLFSCVVYVLLRHFVDERGRMQAELARQHELLRQEQAKSEALLLNILPRPIAERLKRESGVIADGFSEVTVLFADIVGFTELSARIPAADLVALLNGLFSRFDELTERYGAEKIKTIGDAYMVCAGLPLPRPDHAEAIADLALAMQEAMAAFDAERGVTLQVRIGINSGPVVAGVIGLRKFIYDLWGDTVNTASRMESHGTPGAIQVTEDTCERLRDRYVLEPRGVISVKGKGETRTYFLRGRRDAGHSASG